MQNESSDLLVKRVESKHIAWLPGTNHWIAFEEPAWFVYKLWANGVSAEEIAIRCCKKYESDEAISRTFVMEILAKLTEFRTPLEPPAPLISPLVPNAPVIYGTNHPQSSITKGVTRHYLINSKALSLVYESPWLEFSIHPLIAHLEAPAPVSGVRIEVFQQDKWFGVRVTRDQVKTWFFDQADLQKGRVFIEVLDTIYNKDENDWMTIVHGSAVTDGKSTLLFSSACGGGKSTMVTLLQAHGLRVVSDDMVPVDAKTGRIYPFPAALSVKAGAIQMLLPFYPELEQLPVFDFPSLSKQVRYLPLHQSMGDKSLINKAKALIFINYDPSVDFRLEPLSKIETIQYFNTEAWVSPTPENARRYINWITKLPSYKLTYSNNDKAIQAVMGLF